MSTLQALGEDDQGILISLGIGRTSTDARRVTHADLGGLAQELAAHRGRDAWWSPHVWTRDRRLATSWESADLIALDIDHLDEHGEHSAPSPAMAEALCLAVGQHELPWTAWHATPRGARIILALSERATDSKRYSRAVRGATALVQSKLDELRLGAEKSVAGYHVDRAAIDLGRIFWGPRACVDGVARGAEVRLA